LSIVAGRLHTFFAVAVVHGDLTGVLGGGGGLLSFRWLRKGFEIMTRNEVHQKKASTKTNGSVAQKKKQRNNQQHYKEVTHTCLCSC